MKESVLIFVLLVIPTLCWDIIPDRKYCGYQHSDDYFRNENDSTVRINEFPWLARIILEVAKNEMSLECSGSLITARYILTSAICVHPDLYPIKSVRLGEYHAANDTDCVIEPPYEEECNQYEDYEVEERIPHPLYGNTTSGYEIGLIRLKKSVVYSDYIRPICLPFPHFGFKLPQPGDVIISSGWSAHERHGIKKKILGELITAKECQELLILNATISRPFLYSNDSICTTQTTEEEYDSDLGSPVMFFNRIQWFQVGIASSSSVKRTKDRPEVHTKVADYLDWILSNIKS